MDNREKAQTAFDVLNKAYKSLEDDKTRARAMEVVEEAKFKVNQTMEEKRKKLKREGILLSIILIYHTNRKVYFRQKRCQNR